MISFKNILFNYKFVRIMSKRTLEMSGGNSTSSSRHFKKSTFNMKTEFSNTTTATLSSNTNNVKISDIEILSSPIKSENDKKEYRVIRLKNGLTACLIADKIVKQLSDDSESDSDELSDEQSDSGDDDDDKVSQTSKHSEEKLAGASLCVNVGSFSDPKNIQGLAHFLEHMVFMGSEKYPIENDFDAFLSKRGGSDNASTDCETTTFYLECQDRHLAEALDKFANFFISPLMKRDAMTRERQSIESEFQMALPSDSSRREQLMLSFAPADHPVNTFTWGNLITLRDNIDDDALYKCLHEFRRRHYSAHRMCLTLQACLSLDTLQQYVVDYFSNVPNNDMSALNFQVFSNNVFDMKQFNMIYYVKPIKDICQVNLSWILPSQLHKYKSKPHHYVSWLLGDEGKGSLKSYLSKHVWALNITTGVGDTGVEHNSIYALFTVNIILLDDGFKNLKSVLDAVFSYLQLMKTVGPQERLFNEMKMIEEISFRFQTERTAADIVEDISQRMHLYPPEHYLIGEDLLLEYDPKGIVDILNCLTPETVNIMISSSKTDNINYNKEEKWFKTKYTFNEIPNDWIKNWNEIKVYEDFSMPSPNIYLTNDFSIVTDSKLFINQYPELIVNNKLMELWYKPDNKFNLPKAFMYFYFITPYSLINPITAVMVDLFVSILLVHLEEECYPATVAELEYTITSYEKGVMLKLKGFNEKLPLLLQLILQYMKKFSENLTEKLFEAIKEKQKQSYYNNFLKDSKLVRDIRMSILTQNYWTTVDKYNAIDLIKYDNLIQFGKQFLDQIYIQILIQGNISQTTSLGVSKLIEDILQCKSILIGTVPQYRVRQIPLGEYCCRLESFNLNDSNSTVTNYYQSTLITIDDSIYIELLMMIMEEPLFDILRTKEQLGYHVFCTLRETFGVIGFSITVHTQADKFTTNHVDERIEAFIQYTMQLLNEMPDTEFDEIKDDLIKLKLCADVHLEEEVVRNWSEITSQDYLFNRLKLEVDCIRHVTKSKLIEYFSQHASCGTRTNWRKLSVQVIGHIQNDSKQVEYCLKPLQSDNDKYQTITDIEQFKNTLFLFPVHKIKQQ